MNNIFSIRRFGNYCLKQVNEWKQALFLNFLSIAGIYTILLLVFRFDFENTFPYITSGGVQFLIWLSFFVYIARVSSSLSKQLATRSRLVLYLAVPASTLEKYLAHLFSVLLLYPFIFFGGVLVAQYLSEFLSALVWQHPFRPGRPLEGCFSWGDLNFYWVATLNIVTTFILGATLCKHNVFIKTVSAIIVLNIFQLFLWMLVFTGEDVVQFAIKSYSMGTDLNVCWLWVTKVVLYIPALLFGFIAYMRMKELEVNETKK